ncbi:MAG: hypothetical protein CR984_03635 [Proteobacteria bacterium]|nr:MAG: hypothetical protein CR984_03635 [Pseudomonadota bacterium]PIE67986.1 MAG: hypothetical protein CSA23_01130 [Deltaproteobacteria bacterium]
MENKPRTGAKLAVVRTVLANERSLLAFIHTALGCFLGGGGLFKFFGHPILEIIGILLIPISVVTLFAGIKKYMGVKKMIGDIDPEDWEDFKVRGNR